MNIEEEKKPVKAKEPKKAKEIDTKKLLKKLTAPIPEKYLISYEEDGKTFHGYSAQYAIDLLNEEVGLGNWNTIEKIRKEELAGKYWFVSMELLIYINYEGKEISVTGYGAGYAKKGVNSYKAAKTSAFKSACRYLGIGKELYTQGFEDDISSDKGDVVANDNKETAPISSEEKSSEAQALLDRIGKATTKEEVEGLRKEVSEFKAGDAVKKIVLVKFNEKLISFN